MVDGVFGRSHAPTGEKKEAAANGNAIYRGDAGLACALEGREGSVHWCGNTGAHGKVASNWRQQPSC